MSDTEKPEVPEQAVPEQEPAAEPTLKDRVIEVLKTVYDPEIPVDIYTLGLIYDVQIDDELKSVHVCMTLTSPSCPVAGTLPGEVELKVKGVDGVEDAFVELVWDPPWTMEKLSDAARLQLGLL